MVGIFCAEALGLFGISVNRMISGAWRRLLLVYDPDAL